MTVDLFEQLFGQPEESGPSAQEMAARSKVAEEDIHLRDVGAISIDDVFKDEDIDLDRLSEKLDQLIELDCEKRDASPNDLIRIVHNGEVMWLSHEQAEVFLNGPSSPDSEKRLLQMNVRRALKGNTRVLRQEMQTLIAMGLSSLQNYIENDEVDPQQAQRVEQQLRRKWQDVSQLIVGITSSEDNMRDLRKKNPQLDAFESLLGEFVNARAKGDKTKSEKLQNELVKLQRTYLIMARVLEPDTKVLQQNRLDLQQSKKFILSIQKEMAASKRDVLKMEVKRLTKHLRVLKKELMEGEGPTDELQLTAHLEAKGIDISEGINVDDIESRISTVRNQAEHAQLVHSVAKTQEAQVDQVIHYIEEEVVGKAGDENRIQSAINEQQIKAKTAKTPSLKLPSSKDSRMVTTNRRP